jgi:hypothetical protein
LDNIAPVENTQGIDIFQAPTEVFSDLEPEHTPTHVPNTEIRPDLVKVRAEFQRREDALLKLLTQ